MDRSDLELKTDHDRIIHQGAQLNGICTKIDKFDLKLDKMLEKYQKYIDRIDEKLDVEHARSTGHCEAIRQNCPIHSKVDLSLFKWFMAAIITSLISIGAYTAGHISITGKEIDRNKTEISHLKQDILKYDPKYYKQGVKEY